MIRNRQAEHLDRRQRCRIRRSHATDQAEAARYGVSVAAIRLVRAHAEDEHPVRIAAAERRIRRSDASAVF